MPSELLLLDSESWRSDAELMDHSKLNIGAIATEVGIDNETYFYKLFKSKYGITPKEYIMHLVYDRK